jgi:hypothetical protein
VETKRINTNKKSMQEIRKSTEIENIKKNIIKNKPSSKNNTPRESKSSSENNRYGLSNITEKINNQNNLASSIAKRLRGNTKEKVEFYNKKIDINQNKTPKNSDPNKLTFGKTPMNSDPTKPRKYK